ncbi:carbohydrate ABC transporter substrate-binding protein, CUT1 family [Allokutzneria albata]|uniref:Carbohydrate ABC transporter substrate-binding protein, CUT1 family n=1 Tax=Allokutzneria albata TaxID=211114 RepID=A0A1H0AU87_ALLAB|nr:carbohydrate ABC transporter substrate-binding protein, CUT1 family [Allokutzneria albata]
MALFATGCGGGGGTSAGSGELTVWLMNGSAPTSLTDELHKEFESKHPGVKVKYEIQQWTGIQDKLTTALAGNQPPDVVELGNTQNPKFAKEGVLTDLTADVSELGGSQWLEGLKQSGAWQGKQYGVPFYAANRSVIYRKDLFDKAGITEPTSRAEWLEAIRKLKAANASDPEFQPLYLAGQNWYSLLSFIWDEGGDIARQEGEKFTATLETPQVRSALEFYKQLVEVSATKAPKDADEQKPEQAGIYGQGKVGMIIGLPWEVDTAAKTDPSIKSKSAAFPIPSKNPGTTAPVFQGGSNLAIPAGSKNAALAKDYLKLMTSAKYQSQLAKGGMVPGTSKDTGELEASPVGAAMAKGSRNGRAVPASPKWSTVEEGQNPLKDMLTAYLTGAKDATKATADAAAKLNGLLG